MKRFNIILILIIVLMGIAIAFFGPIILKETTREKIPEEEVIAVPPKVVTTGVVVSLEEVEVSSKVLGVIHKILVSDGKHITKGQTLVILNNEELQTQIKEAEGLVMKATADYEKALTDYERSERMYKANEVVLDVLEEYKHKLKLSEGELHIAQAKLMYAKAISKNYILKSPINGVVLQKYLNAGEVVTAGVPILRLANTNLLRIKAEIDETDVGKVDVGQRAEVTVDAYPDRIYNGSVERISEDVKRKRETNVNFQEITIRLDSFEGLRIGMTVDVRFYPDKKEAIYHPIPKHSMDAKTTENVIETAQSSTKTHKGKLDEYYIQVGTFKYASNAEELLKRLKVHYPDTYIVVRDNFNKLRIPGIKTKEEGELIIKKIDKEFKLKSFLQKI